MGDPANPLLADATFLQSPIPEDESSSAEKRPLTFDEAFSAEQLPSSSSLFGEVGKGVAAGGRSLYGTLGGIVGLAGDEIGSDSLKSWGLNTFQDQEEANAEKNAPAVASYKDIHSFGNFADYAAYNLSKGITEMVPMLAAGEGGGLIAGNLAKGAVEKAVQFGVEKGLSQEAAEAAVSNAVRAQSKELAASTFAEPGALGGFTGTAEDAAKLGGDAYVAKSAQNSAKFLGAQAGNAATIVPESIGDEYGQTKDAGTALEYGAASGTLNSLAMGIVAAPAFRKMLGIGSEAAAKNSFAKSMATRVGTDTAVMGGLAYPSAYLGQEAQASVDPTFDINSPEAKQQRAEAVVSGGLMGAAFGGLGSLEFLGKTSPLTADALKKVTFAPPAAPDGGKIVLPDEATKHELSPEFVIEHPDTGEAVKVQKNMTANQWTVNHDDGSRTILDSRNGAHNATLELLAESRLHDENNPEAEPEKTDEKPPTQSEPPADTSEFYPAAFKPITGPPLAGPEISERSINIPDQAANPDGTVKQKFSDAGTALGQLADNRQDTRTEFPVGAAAPEPTQNPNVLVTAFRKVAGADLGSAVSEKKAQADSAALMAKTPENFSQNLQVGDSVTFDHPEHGKVEAIVTQATTPDGHGHTEADQIKVQYNNPTTGRKKTQVVPRTSWDRIKAAKPETPSTDEIVNTALGENPTPEKLQAAGLSNIMVEGNAERPSAVSGDMVLKDGLVQFSEPPATKNAPREADPIHSLLDEAAQTGDYSKIVEMGGLPARYDSKSKTTRGIWTGGQLSSADWTALKDAEDGVRDGGRSLERAKEITDRLEKAKETTVRQMNQGLRVVAPKGSIAPPGFEFTKLPNGLMQVTAVHDYLGTSWRMRGAVDPVMSKSLGRTTYFPGTPDTFSVDVPAGTKGKFSQKRGNDIFTTRFNAPSLRSDRSEINREGWNTRRENKNAEADSELKKNPLNHTEGEILKSVHGRAVEHIENSTFPREVKDEASSAVGDRLARDIRKSGVKAPEPKNEKQKSLTSMLLNNISKIIQGRAESIAEKANAAVHRAEARGVGRAGMSAKGEKGTPLLKKTYGSVDEHDLNAAKNFASGVFENGVKVQDTDFTKEGLKKIGEQFSKILDSDKDTGHSTKQLKDMERFLGKIKEGKFTQEDFEEAVTKGLITPKSYVADKGPKYSELTGDTLPGSPGVSGGGTLSGRDAIKIEERVRNTAGRKLTDKEYSKAVQSTLEQARRRQMKLTQADKNHLTSVMDYHKAIGSDLSENNVYTASKYALLDANKKTQTAGARSRTMLSIDDPETGLSGLHAETEGGVEGGSLDEHLADVPGEMPEDTNEGDAPLKTLAALPESMGSNPNVPPAFRGLSREHQDFIDNIGVGKLTEHEALLKAKKKSNLLNKSQSRTWKQIKKALYDNIETNRRDRGTRDSDSSRSGDTTPLDGATERASGGLESPARGGETEATSRGSNGSGGSAEDTTRGVQEPNTTAPRGHRLGASPEQSRALSAAVKEHLVRSAGRLSPEEIAKMSPEEIDKAHAALTTQADSSAAHGNQRIESATPRVEDVVNKSLGDLVAGAKEENSRAEAASRAETIRKNHADLVRSGAYKSTSEFLSRVASGKLEGVPQDLALVARTMLSNTKVNWNKVAVQIGRFTDKNNEDGRAAWSGLATKQGDGHNVALNLDAKADRGIVGTYIHELLHTIERDKLTGKVKLNPVEAKALEEIKSAYQAFLDRAGIEGTPAEIEARAKELGAGAGANDYGYTFLRSPEEFVRGLQESPDLHALGQSLGLDYGDGKGPLKGTARKVYTSLTELVSGRKADANSPLVRAFSSAFDLTHSDPRENKASKLHGELKDFAKRESWIRDQVESRNLRGTTDDRTALLKEWDEKNGVKKEAKKVSPKKPEPPDDEPEPPKNPEPPKPKGPKPSPREKKPVVRRKVEKVAPAPEPPKVEQKAEKPAKESAKKAEKVAEKPVKKAKEAASAEEQEAPTYDLEKYEPPAEDEPLTDAAEAGDLSWISGMGSLESRSRESLGESMLRLGREKGQDMFRLPHELSKSEDLGEVLDSTGSKFSSFDAYGMKLISETPIKGDHVLFPAEDKNRPDGYSDGKVIAAENGVLTIRPTDKSEDFQLPETQTVAAKGSVRLYDDSLPNSEKGTLTVDSSDGSNGTIRQAASIYQAIYQWAHNTGQKVVPDTTTSWAGHFRRNAQQISSAIRNQDAEHFRPTIDQRERMFPNLDKDASLRKWESLDTAGKVSALMRAERSYIEQAAPELVSHRYDPTTESFTDENGASVSVHDIRSRITEGLAGTKDDGSPDPFRVGEASLRRYLGATKPALENPEGITAYGTDNSGHLDKSLYSPERVTAEKVADVVRERIPFGKALLGEKIGTLKGGTYLKGGLLNSSHRGLDPREIDNFNNSRHLINEQESRANFLAGQLDAAVKANFPEGTEAPTEVMNTALGNISNPLTEADIEQVAKVRKDRGDKEAAKVQAELIQKNREAFRERQALALESLPADVSAAIVKMSDHIAGLSSTLNKLNVITGDLKATVDANGGIYLNRSYQIFDDPKWAEKVRKQPEVMNAATKFLRDQIIAKETTKAMNEAAKEGSPITLEEARKQAVEKASDAAVSHALERLLTVNEDAFDRMMSFGKIPGRKDLSILDGRGNLAPEIQDLWGVNRDPRLNYARTVAKMASLIGDHEFLTETRDLGLSEGWIFDPKAEENEGEPAPHGYIKLASEGNKSMTPLDGLYVRKEMADALIQMFPRAGHDGRPAWLRWMMKATGTTMAMKIVYSPAAQIRNFMGNPIFLMAGGNMKSVMDGKFKEAFTMTNPFAGVKTSEDAQKMVERLHRHGILNQSVGGRLLRELLQDQRNAGLSGHRNTFQRYVLDPVNKVSEVATKAYEFGDSIYKTTIWMAEREKYEKAFPGMTADELDAKAAKIARAIHPTYDLTPSFTKELSKFPVIAPFIRFTTEIYRTSINLARQAHSEIMEGRATKNKELEAIGWQRVRGMAAVALGPSVAIAAFQAANGVTNEDQEALRKFLPEWQQNSQLFLFKQQDGKVGYYDWSFMDAYSLLRRPIKALVRAVGNSESAGDAFVKAPIAALGQMMAPFSNEQILSGAVFDVMRNKNSASGAPVFNPQDSGDRIAESVILHLTAAFQPGAVDSAIRIGKAAAGATSDSGRSYNLTNELLAPALGRISELDVNNALQFQASQYLRDSRDAAQLLNHELMSRGSRTQSDVIGGYERSNSAKESLVKSLRNKYLSAIELGMSPKQAEQLLRGAHLGNDVTDMVVKGYYSRLTPSNQSLSVVKDRGQTDRIQAINEAIRKTPERVSIP